MKSIRWARRFGALWLVFCALVLSGCAAHVAAPPPSFASPIVRPLVTVLPGVGPDVTNPAQVPQRVSGRVVIDPGHGGKDPGAQIPGVDEKAVNLSVARLVAKKLSDRGVTVSMTRKSDVFIELADRAAAGRGADLFVSIHADSHPSPEKVGHSLLLPQSGDPQALLAGRYIDQQMTAAGSPSHIMRLDTRGLMVLKRSECPAVLVELGYLSNFSEAKKLATAGYQEQLAEGIADGIVAYLGKRK